jgi:hypothetical protein
MQDDRPPDRRQLDDVLDALLPFAHQLLDKHGEFFPFGGAMGRDGKVSMVAGDTGTDHPPSDEVMELIRAAKKRDRDNYVAVGLCYDVRVRTRPDAPVTDAICVSLEHEGGMAVDVVEPYAKRPNKVEYGPLAAQQGRRVVFSNPP